LGDQISNATIEHLGNLMEPIKRYGRCTPFVTYDRHTPDAQRVRELLLR
jgi:hypothetical protein